MVVKSVKGYPEPELRPLEYVSPSRLAALETCFLQAAFDGDPQYADKAFRGPKARLGSACHALLERITKGELDEEPKETWRPKLEELWEEEVAEQEAATKASTLEKHFGPAQSWPGYNIRKARVMNRARKLLERRGKSRTAGGSTQAEKYYRAFGGRLRGRADVVRSLGERVEIEDYKTGDVYEEQDGSAVLKPRYRSQLLLYAAMHRWTEEYWPVAGHVVPMAGEKASISIDPAEAEQEAQYALELLEDFNTLVAQGTSPERLASPSLEACRFCSYKAFCEPFWRHVSPSWDWSRSVSVDGVVLRANVGALGDWTVEVEVRDGNTGKGVYEMRGSRSLALEENQCFRATNLMSSHRQEHPVLIVTDHTELWTSPLSGASQTPE